MRFAHILAAVAASAAALTASPPATAQEPACYAARPFETPPVPARSETIEGRPVLRHVPPNARGIVYLFHGTGGSERFAERLHSRRVLARLVAAGYGYAASASLDRTNPVRWNVKDGGAASNPDIAYMLALHRALIAKGEITAKTPVFTMGMSNGGAFANLFATVAKRQGLPVAAVADYMGPFPEAMRGGDPKDLPPTFVVVSKNDGYVDASRTSAVAEGLAKGGAKVELHLDPEQRVCADTFRVLGFDAPQSATLAERTLPAQGVVDAQGRRALFTGEPVITPADMATLRQKLGGLDKGRDVANEILIAWAAHEMRSDWTDKQLAFFDAVLSARH